MGVLSAGQQEAMGKQLADADNALASFKHEHDIGSFDERRKILLEQQGRLEATLAGTESRIAELGARVGELDKQLHTVSGGKSPASALQGMVEAYRQRQREAGNTYRGSASVDEARQQALARETEVVRMQSTQAFAVQSERLKADADLRANTAARDSLRTQLASVKAQGDSINADEAELHRLERKGWLAAKWEPASKDQKREFKYYRLTAAGKKRLATEESKWKQMASAIARVMWPAEEG